MIYKILGGHMGSYQELWHTIKISNGTISSALDELNRKALVHLKACILCQPNLITWSILKKFTNPKLFSTCTGDLSTNEILGGMQCFVF